ncbi:hypothetical protein [Pyrobaculum aerophilum]|uniref:hypothetical protein n=1 Tax=Pyrobaculum aerophilum TaxID=13773 RepID=UPI0023F08BCE|nr:MULTISPECIES: hypothetical protein [Pyrobaculum]MCX8136205.1 hypothetical protein [Pyrobaculum aerophilum]
MILSLVAALLAFLIAFVEPIAVPIYATTPVDVKNAAITIGGFSDQFIQLPIIGEIISVILLILTIYLEVFLKIKIGRLPKAIASLSVLYATPLPYIYIVNLKDIAVVMSNFAKYTSLSIYALALLIAASEGLLSTSRRARVIADISTTEEKTERGV